MAKASGTILVTGAHGFIGGRLVRRLAADGHAVRGLVRRDDEVPGAEAVVGDVADPEVVRSAVAGADAVVHTAAYFGSDVAEARRVNIDGTRLLAEAASSERCRRFVHISTCGAYDLVGVDLVDETTPLWAYDETSRLVYGVSKAEADRVVSRLAAEGLPAVILRPPNVLGADRLNPFAYDIVFRIREGQVELGGDGANTWPVVHVDDLIDAILLALVHPAAVGQAYTIVGDHTTWAEYAGRIAAWLGSELGRRDPRPPYDTFTGRFSSEKVRRELGHAPRHTFEDAMMETKHFLEEHGIV